jgi:inorganic pyrophosphatase|nr:inorganic diphosphatase [Candidatus Acidoferrales bacterium]
MAARKCAPQDKMAPMKVFIQNEAGSFVKHSHDEKKLILLADQQVSRAYPFPYGFILKTTAEDGDNVDCFVLTRENLRTGQIVECEPIGLMEQIEDGEIDHNVLAALLGEAVTLDPEIKQTLTEFVSHVFDHIPGKKTQVGEFRSIEGAIRHIKRYQD